MSLEKEHDIVAIIQKDFADSDIVTKKERRIDVVLGSSELFEFASRMKHTYKFEHLSAVSCVDWLRDNQFELVYHFWSYTRKVLVTAKIRIDRAKAEFETITSIWHQAKFFERDIHEMFGIEFTGNDDLEKYILTDWEGEPPMRKDFITREFALNFYSFKDDYHPEWLRELEQAGE